jgi:hypothetical protein
MPRDDCLERRIVPIGNKSFEQRPIPVGQSADAEQAVKISQSQALIGSRHTRSLSTLLCIQRNTARDGRIGSVHFEKFLSSTQISPFGKCLEWLGFCKTKGDA